MLQSVRDMSTGRRLALVLAAAVLAIAGASVVLGGQQALAEQDLMAGSAAGQDVEAQEPAYASVAKVKLSKKKATIRNNGKLKLVATLVPDIEGGKIKDKKVTWKVSNPRVASITQKGVVQGKKAGTVKVTAKASNGKKATAKIKVIIEKSKMATAIPVLTYHRIASDAAKARFYSGTNLATSASLFNSQMKWLKSNGYHTISTEEFWDWRVNGTFLPKKSVLITIDDGLYETYHVAYPILKKYKLKATSFVIGAYAGKKTYKYNPNSSVDHYVGWDVINKVREEYPNLEFQSHTYNMHHRASSGRGVASVYGTKRLKADFAKNKKFGFTSIAYPYGHTSSTLLSVVRANKSMKVGFGYMMSWPATRKSPLYNIPRFKVFGDGGLSGFQHIVRTAR